MHIYGKAKGILLDRQHTYREVFTMKINDQAQFTQQNIFKGWGIRLIPFCLCQSQQSPDTGKEKTGDHSRSGGDQHGYCRPFGALGLLADGHAGSGAGPMHQ